MPSGLIALLSSKKGLMSLVAVVIAIAAHFGIDIDPESMLAVLSPIVAFVIGQGIADSGKEGARIEYAAASASPFGIGSLPSLPTGFWAAVASLLQSKKAAAMVVGLAVTIFSKFGLNLSSTGILALVLPILTQIVSQGVADKGKEAAIVDVARQAQN